MRNFDTIRINRAALHLVNPRQRDLTLSELELSLSDDVRDFLISHVQHGLRDSQATAARFNVTEIGSAAHTCQQIVDSEAKFVERSSAVARLLYEASENDERVSDGALAVLRCTGNDQAFVALVKLDPSSVYRPVTASTRGRKVVELELESDVLPSVRERIQKAAFVRTSSGQDFHLLVVDRQRKGDAVSRFFIQDFLGAVRHYDDVDQTKTLYRSLLDVKNEVQTDLQPAERARLDTFIHGQVAGGHVNLDDLLEALPVDEPEIRDRFAAALDSAPLDREFDLDQLTAEKLFTKTRYRGDGGLTVTAPSDLWPDLVTIESPDDDGRWTITIRTTEWRET